MKTIEVSRPSEAARGNFMTEPKITNADRALYDALSAALRAEALACSEITCRMCGLGQGEIDASTGRRAALHVDCLTDTGQRGKDKLSNVIATCSICMEGSKSIVIEKPSLISLLTQIRRAREQDQLAVLQWLRRKFNM